MVVLIWNVPTMMEEIIRQIIAADPHLIAISPGSTRLEEAILQCSPDVIVTGVSDDELDSACTAFLMEHAQRRVLGISTDGRSACLYRLRPDYVSLGEISGERLLRAIREPAGQH